MTVHQPVPDPVPPKSDLRVLTYNVRYAGIDTGNRAWESRRDAVLDEIRRLDPDVVALQEVWQDQLSDLRAGLSYDWVARDDGPEHTAIGYRGEQFDSVDAGQFWLSEPEAAPGEPGWDGTYQRVVTWVRLAPAEGPEFGLYSVHLDHEGEQARREGTTLVRDHLGECGVEAVVAGDYNCPPGSPAYRRLADHSSGPSLSPARTRGVVEGPDATYVGFESDEDSQQIDHVFVTPEFAVERVITCVPPRTNAGVPPSDHRPVFVDLSYRD